MGKLEQYRSQVHKATVGTSSYNRERYYTGRDLWLFYLSLKPREVRRIQEKKGPVVSSIQKGIFNAIFNNDQFPFRAIGVANGKYDPIIIGGAGHGGALTPDALIKKCYDELIKSARAEIRSKHSGLGSRALGLNISLSNQGAAKGAVSGDFQKYIQQTFQQIINGVGHSYNHDVILSNQQIMSIAERLKNNPANYNKLYQTLRNLIIGELFATGSLSNNQIIHSFTSSPHVDAIIKTLQSKTPYAQEVQKDLGLMAEDVIVTLLKYFNNVMITAGKNAKAHLLNHIKNTGIETDKTSYFALSKDGKNLEKKLTTAKKPFFITPDIKMDFNEVDMATGGIIKTKELKISLKTPSNMDRIIYKASRADEGDIWTKIAGWNKVLQTYAGFAVFNRSANMQFKLYQVFAASIASLAVAGTAEHRALITISMSKGHLNIKSLDVVLQEMKDLNQTRLTMNEIRVKNKDAYISNARVLASGRVPDSKTGRPYSTLDPNLISQEVYEKYSKLKELNLNYILVTKGK